MKPKFGREIALLSLPVLLIGGVAMWNGKIKSWSGFGAPRGLYEGKPRLEITEWKSETPTALDFARGISSRWKVTTWHGGACPADGQPPRYGGMRMPENLVFAWKRAGKWHQTPFRYGPSELDVMNFGVREKPTSNRVHLGLPMDLVPHDAEEVRLRGHMNGWMMCRSGSITFPSVPLDVLLKAPGEKWPEFVGSRQSPLKLLTSRQNLQPLNPASLSKNRYWEVETDISYSGADQDGSIYKARSWIMDAKGRFVAQILGGDFWHLRENKGKARWGVQIRQLKTQNGPFTLKSWVYVDENEWPLQVSIPLNLDGPPKPIR